MFPLDARSIYYESAAKLLNERRPEFWENLADNEFLLAVPQPRRSSEGRPLLTSTLCDLHVHDRGTVCFPRQSKAMGLTRANLPAPAWETLRKSWKLASDLTDEPARDLVSGLFRLALAVMYAPSYESEHAEAIQSDWARVPIPREREVFDRLVVLGREVSVLLDPQQDAFAVIEKQLSRQQIEGVAVPSKAGGAVGAHGELVTVAYYGAAPGRWVEREYRDDEDADAALWGPETGDLFINDDTSFVNVPRSIWELEIGGYPVLKKWLGYRQASRRAGKPMTIEELRYFREMVLRLGSLLVCGPHSTRHTSRRRARPTRSRSWGSRPERAQVARCSRASAPQVRAPSATAAPASSDPRSASRPPRPCSPRGPCPA